MQCPPEIAEIVHEILRIGILRIRSCGWNYDAARCAIEADHLHNLPAMLTDYRPELLDSYLRVERVDFANRSDADDIACFHPLWNSLTEKPDPFARQRAMKLPSIEEINPIPEDLDGQHAARNFLRKSVEEIAKEFNARGLEYQEDFMFMGATAFCFISRQLCSIPFHLSHRAIAIS